MHRIGARLAATRAALSVVALAVALAGFAGSAAAEDLNLNVQRYLPSPHPYDFGTVMSSHVRDTLDFGLGLSLHWGQDQMVFEDSQGRLDEVLTGRLTADLMMSMSFFRYLSVGLDFPLHLYNGGESANAEFDSESGRGPIDRGSVQDFSWGDLRLSAKVRILDAKETMFGVAFALDLSLPTGTDDAFAGDDGVGVTPRLIGDLNIEGYRAAINIGYRHRPDYQLRWLEVQPEFFLSIAGAIPIIEHNLDLLAELETTAKTADFFSDSNTDFLEGRIGARYTSDCGIGGTLWLGAAFLTAYGSTLWDMTASVFWAPRTISRDMDQDGVDDDLDQCPNEPEDYDTFADTDGCPDPDNDRDGVLDLSDQCPLKPEDRDGFRDDDGCPEPDNDGDRVLDVNDGCPNEPEDWDGFQDEDGCPDTDNDGDGVLDAADRCPNEPEDLDGCMDEDGCPEPGNVCVTDTEIRILQKVYFRTNRAKIKRASYPILDEVARVLIDTPQIRVVEIQGHTDSRGRKKKNLKLSEQRAKAVVKYLVKAGVDKSRLRAKGYGDANPIDTNDTTEGRAANRRVEFHIIERD